MFASQLSVLFYDLGKWAGLAGFACLSFLIISGDTARFFDRRFGLDKIIKFQRKFALFTVFLVALHPLFFIISDSSFARSLVLPDFSILPFAAGTIAFYTLLSIQSASLLYKRISYRAWQYIHAATYALFFTALYHAVNWGSDAQNIYIKSLYAVLTAGIAAGFIYRTQYKIRKRFSGRFYAKEIRQETHDTFSLILTAPKNFRFKAGQFCFLRLDKNKLYARHPFTIASSPHEKDLKFTIKNTGRFTAAALELKAGEEVFVDGPFGVFTLKNSNKNLVFIAGGVGITPFASMISENLFNGNKRNITLLYGSKTEKDIIFKKELDAVTENWFKKAYVLSNKNGYIGEDIIREYVKDIPGCLYYICGPEAMKNKVKKALHNLGAKNQDIKTEDFFW